MQGQLPYYCYETDVTDLEIEKQLVPLFDFTGNPYARQVLSDLWRHLPEDQPGIYARQQIIKALIDNGDAYTELTYSRYDFEEAYRFLCSWVIKQLMILPIVPLLLYN